VIFMQTRRGYAALLATIFIWGTTFIATKVLLRQVGPFQLTLLRFVIAFLVLVPFAVRQGFKLKDIFNPTFMLFGLTGTTLYYAMQNLGMSFTSVSSTSLILSVVPVLTAILAVIFLKEKLSRLQVVGILLVTAGVALIALYSSGSSESSNPLLGNLLVFAGGLSWAIYTIQGRKMVGDFPALRMTTASTGAGLLFLIPFAVWEAFSSGLPHFTLLGAADMLYLGVIASALTMFLWNYSLHFLPATVASTYINLVPIIGVASSYLLGEKPPLLQLVGGLLAIAGVWISSLKPGRSTTTSPQS
jgi:drug/metabolite transporter (DMT)-like permease